MTRALSIKDQLRILSGAIYATELSGAPRHGMPGCRAVDGQLVIEAKLWPPSKANQYEIISLSGHGSLKSSATVGEFQVALARVIREQLDALGLTVAWYIPAGRKHEKPLNPVYGADTEVDVEVHLYEPARTNRDTDGVDKVTFDVLTAMGIWRDDAQLGNRATIRADHVGERDADAIRIILSARPVASWACNRGGRPTTTRTRKAHPHAPTPTPAQPAAATRRRSAALAR